ncbi:MULTISPECIES: cupin domain-containing protein [Burkholderia]|uniref:Cupin domain-containing protein n=1 Tax=Burkholderia sola TaxID=2843302 RepID=A0ABV2CA27_9BURK|nr:MULTISPECIES: cupin domain-containing protein [unclassified Burkholderia]MBP0607649.1 cupin domain-containing protein [Burkholderia sp. CpTa8-5]MBP0717619.1 cupin domain-containing protein [Burkholderia sp. AcTa6-5]
MDTGTHFPVNDKMLVFPVDRAAMLDYSQLETPTKVAVSPGGMQQFDSDSTHFVIVQSGELDVSHKGNIYQLRSGQFGCFPGGVSLAGNAQAILVTSLGYEGSTLVGGPVEALGRLRYIDGCTSSVLLAPPVRGEPCLNFLHLPRNTSQTMHTHPTIRVGLILSGDGRCDTHHGLMEFRAGTAFVIPPGVAHSFQSQDESMRIVIYHPDSDSGPTHTDHTMLNRTYVDGATAKTMTDIHTRLEVQS